MRGAAAGQGAGGVRCCCGLAGRCGSRVSELRKVLLQGAAAGRVAATGIAGRCCRPRLRVAEGERRRMKKIHQNIGSKRLRAQQAPNFGK